MSLTPEEQKKRKQRNWAVAGILIAFIAIVYVVTIVKIGGNIASHGPL